MTELKNCPFCGGKAAMESMITVAEMVTRFRVRCTGKGCAIAIDWDNFNQDEAAMKWNRRADNG